MLPVRGAAVRSLELPLPPARMPLVRARRPLKRWRWVGVFGPELMLCVADARVAGVARRWWAVAEPDGTLHGRAGGGVRLVPGRVEVERRDARVLLELDEGGGVEVVSPAGRSYIWTRKQAGVPARGVVEVGGRRWEIDREAFVDDSAGYHERRTTWRWSAGCGRSVDGRPVAWNLVSGIHDSASASERTVWVDGVPREAEAVEFAPDLAAVGELRFRAWCEREDHVNRILFRNDYRQPFGEFSGTLPGGPELATGYGVMEWHDVRW